MDYERDILVEELQSEIASLYANIAEQKETYQTTMERLQTDADLRVKEAQKQVDSIKVDYEKYKVEMTEKYKHAATPEQVAKLEELAERARERADDFKDKLDSALEKLRQNRLDRQMLQGEMVALKQGYIDKLNELEDQLEFAQDDRVRVEQKGAERIAALEEESRQKLKEAIESGRKQVEELTLSFTRQISVKDEEISKTKAALGDAQETLQQKEAVIEHMEAEAQSIRKLLKKSLVLAKSRISRRLQSLVSSRRKQQGNDE
jgi:hypothetical protein